MIISMPALHADHLRFLVDGHFRGHALATQEGDQTKPGRRKSIGFIALKLTSGIALPLLGYVAKIGMANVGTAVKGKTVDVDST